MQNKPSKIYYLSDFLRPDFVPCLMFINFIKNMLGFAIKYGCEYELDDSFIDVDKKLVSKNGFNIIKFYELNNVKPICKPICKSIFNKNDYKPTVEEWAKIFSEEPSSKSIEYLRGFIEKDALIIGYETAPILLKAFDKLGINYIDTRISSMKFFNDLILGVKTNNEEIFSKIIKYKLSEEALYYKANLLKCTSEVRKANNFEKESFSLIIGQVIGDSSLNFEGKALSLCSFKQELKEIKIKNKNIYYKKHPTIILEKEVVDLINELNIKILPNDINMYNLLSNPNLECLYAISSGTLQEAKYFGKKTEYFKSSIYDYIDYDDNISFCKHYINVFQHAYRPYFWNDILECKSDKKLMNSDEYNNNNYENMVRKMLNLYWSYEA